MASAFPRILARTHCPSCSARLRIRAHLPEGSPVRCRGCQTSFRYQPGQEAVAASGKTGRTKEVSCPRCDNRFLATISGAKKVKCPACAARISFRKSGTTRLQPATTAAAQRAGGYAAGTRSRTQFNDNLGSPAFELGPQEIDTAEAESCPAAGNPDWTPPWEQTQTPPSARPTPGRLQSSNKKPVAVAAVFLVILGLVPVWSLLFGEVKRETVKGVVTFEGKQVVSGTVVIQGEDGVSLISPIGADGSYVVPNVPRGKVRIAVISTDPAQLPNYSPDDPTAAAWFPLPDNFGDLNRSGISVQVVGETTFNIVLN